MSDSFINYCKCSNSFQKSQKNFNIYYVSHIFNIQETNYHYYCYDMTIKIKPKISSPMFMYEFLLKFLSPLSITLAGTMPELIAGDEVKQYAR